MTILGTLLGLAIIGVALVDGFEAMVLPRRVTRTLRPTRLYYRAAWQLWALLAGSMRGPRWRETCLSIFGPLSLLTLIVLWVAALCFGFALIHWSLGTVATAGGDAGFHTCCYLSGVTFTTLGYGDVLPTSTLGRFLTVAEAGVGFGFMAVVIGYLPVVYQAFSRREQTIILLDARAGSPPSAAEVLLRLTHASSVSSINSLLVEWERWASELLESHLSFPVLGYYRSQHDNQSWQASLAMILDTCAFLLTSVKGADRYQAQLTFAMARHAVVDLALVFRCQPVPPDPDRLPPARYAQLSRTLHERPTVQLDDAAVPHLTELRGTYEPFINALSHYFRTNLPPIWPETPTVDNWQTSAWMRRIPGFGQLPSPRSDDGHFD